MSRDDQLQQRRHRIPHVETYDVTVDELDQIELESMSVGQDFSFGSVCLTAALSFLITIVTVPIESERAWNSFLIIMLVGFIGAAYFGIRWYRGKKHGVLVIERIREREIGPYGEEGREIKANEAADLPAEESAE